MQINLSTTTKSPDGLDSVFEQNIGLDDTVAFGPSSASLLSAGGNGLSTFDLYFRLSNSFRFNPADGNLLVDFRIYQGIRLSGPPPPQGIAILDAFNIVGDSVSSVYAFGGPGLPTSGQASSLGLATDFIVTPAPKLAISLQSNNLLFRWVNQPDGFMLQQSAVIGSGADWQAAGGTVATNGGYKEVTLPLDPNAAARFFRLILPPPSSASANVQTSAPPETALKQEH